MALNYESPSPVDTHNELPSFVPEPEYRAAHAAAQQIARHRDQLVSENAHLRREVEALQRSARELDEATRNGDGNGNRRIALLREALARKDNEILALKSHQVGRDRAMLESREVVERLRRERAELEERLRSRDGVFQAIEAERATLGRTLESVRQEREQAASALMQADGTVHEWRRYCDDRTRERDEARRQLQEMANDNQGLRAALHALNAERQRATDAHARELAGLRAELATVVERCRAEAEGSQESLVARFEGARAAHAIALRAMEDEQAEELAAERAARIAAEEATLAMKRTMEDAKELAMESVHADHLDAVAALQQEHSDRLRAMEADLARVNDLERELEATREALGTYATDVSERVETALREAKEAQGYRDRYARKLAAAMEQIRVMRAESESEARAQGEALKSLGGMVGRMTARMVHQAASEIARRSGRTALEGGDVDQAIGALTDALPAEVADELWAQRDAFVSPALAE